MSFEGFSSGSPQSILATTTPIDESKFESLDSTVFSAHNVFALDEVNGNIFDGICSGFGTVADKKYAYSTLSNQLYAFSTTEMIWTPVSAAPLLGDGKVVGVHGDKVYVYGGNSYNFGSIWTYDPATDVWEEIATMVTSWDGGSGVLMEADNSIYLFGGKLGGSLYSQATKRYDLTTGILSTHANIPIGLAFSSAIEYDDEVIMLVGGDKYPVSYPNDIWLYSVAMDTYSEIGRTPVPLKNLIPQKCSNGISVHGGYNAITGLPGSYIGINSLTDGTDFDEWKWVLKTQSLSSDVNSVIQNNTEYFIDNTSSVINVVDDTYTVVKIKE